MNGTVRASTFKALIAWAVVPANEVFAGVHTGLDEAYALTAQYLVSFQGELLLAVTMACVTASLGFALAARSLRPMVLAIQSLLMWWFLQAVMVSEPSTSGNPATSRYSSMEAGALLLPQLAWFSLLSTQWCLVGERAPLLRNSVVSLLIAVTSCALFWTDPLVLGGCLLVIVLMYGHLYALRSAIGQRLSYRAVLGSGFFWVSIAAAIAFFGQSHTWRPDAGMAQPTYARLGWLLMVGWLWITVETLVVVGKDLIGSADSLTVAQRFKRKHAEDEHSKSSTDLAGTTAYDRQSEFLATMSHELRTPLSCIVGLSRLIGSNHDYGSELRTDMGTVERLAVQLLHTVDDGLAFVRNEPERKDPDVRLVRMGYLLRDIKAVSTWLAQQNGNELHFLRVRNIPAELQFDEQRLRQILINLLTNASRYCQNGTITLGITLSERGGKPMLEWLVEDTGRGMSQVEQKKYMEPFSKSNDSQGMGIGLALVRRLLDELGGRFKLDSETGKGTRIRFGFPVQFHGADIRTDLEEDSLVHGGTEAVSAPMALLPQEDLVSLDLLALRKFVRMGQISDIELWLKNAKDAQRLSPETAKFIRKMEKALKVFDLQKIRDLIDQVDTPLSFI